MGGSGRENKDRMARAGPDSTDLHCLLPWAGGSCGILLSDTRLHPHVPGVRGR